MKRMMRRLFALLMAAMMLCGSLPLSALAEIAPSDPIEEHSQGAWMYSALSSDMDGDTTPEFVQDVDVDNSVLMSFFEELNREGTPVYQVLWLSQVDDTPYDYGDDPESVPVGAMLTYTLYLYPKGITHAGDSYTLNGNFTLTAGDENEITEGKITGTYTEEYLAFQCTYTVDAKDKAVKVSVAVGDLDPLTVTTPVEETPAYTVTKKLGDVEATEETPTIENTTNYIYNPDSDNTLSYTIEVTNTGNTELNLDVSTALAESDDGVAYDPDGSIYVPYSYDSDPENSYTYTYDVKSTDKYLSDVTTIICNDDYTAGDTSEKVLEIDTTVEDYPELTVEMTADTTEGANLNDVITYTITVTNSGNVPVNGITVTDTSETEESPWPKETIESLAPGASQVYTQKHTITEENILEDGVTRAVKAEGTAQMTEGAPELIFDDADAPVYTIAADQTLTVEKKANKTSGVALGDEITYTITVTGSDNLTVHDITVTDDKTGESWEISTLSPKASNTHTVTYTVTQADVDAGEIVNTATASGTDVKDDPVNGEGKATVTTIAAAPALTVTNSANKASGAVLGEEITYTIKVTNSGNVTVKDITVTDPKTGLNKTIESLAPDASTEYTTTHTITEADILAGSFENTATATGTPARGGEVTNSGTATVTTVAQAPALTVEKTADKTTGAALGEEITYTITVTNSGNVTVSDITVNDPKTGLNQNVGNLAPGASTSVATTHKITQTDIDAGSFVNTATATGKDPNGGNVTKSDDETVNTVAAAPALTVTKTADKTEGVALGEEITYTITVTNSGNVTVSGITVTDPLTGLNETIESLAPSGSKEYTTTHTITEADILDGSFENTATATGTDPKGEEVTGSGSATVTTVDAAPALTVVKTANKTEGAALGEEITYTITVTNSGNVTVSNITVADPLTSLNQNVGTLAPNASTSVTTTHTITEADILAGSFENTATATGTDPNGGEVSGSDDETVTTAAQAPALTVVKTAGPGGALI